MIARFVRTYHQAIGHTWRFYLFGGRIRAGLYVPDLRNYGPEFHIKGASFAYFAMVSRREGAGLKLSVGRMDWGRPVKSTYATLGLGRLHVDFRPEGADWEREFSMVEVESDRVWAPSINWRAVAGALFAAALAALLVAGWYERNLHRISAERGLSVDAMDVLRTKALTGSNAKTVEAFKNREGDR